jgi:transposase
MYIRQECFLSFDEILKFQPESKLQAVLAQLDFTILVEKLSKPDHTRGPKGHQPLPLLYSLVAMQLEKIKNTAGLVQRLHSDPTFRYNCGFNVLDAPPSESTFSRFISKIAESEFLEEEFKLLVLKAKDFGIVDGSHVAIDSTEINAFEKSKPSSKIVKDGVSPNWGKKKDTDGNDHKWFGWKLHILADCKSELPLNIIVTPANVNDGTQAIPLIKQLMAHYGSVFCPKYYLMDKIYDVEDIYGYIIEHTEGQAIIAYNKRGSYAPPEGLNENLHPVCAMGYELAYWGLDGDYLKFRCPHAVSKIDCPQGQSWCSKSNYGYCLKINYKKNHRLFCYPIRGSEKWQSIYDKRNSIERCNSRLKQYLNTNNIRSSRINKAKAWALLNCIALIAGTLAVNSVKNLSTVA